MKFLDQTISPLGMGCWPIGGAMYAGTQSLGYTQVDDDMSMRSIHAALAGGFTLFDTAAAYGAGHAERLLGRALQQRADALIVTKIGIGINEANRQIAFDPYAADMVAPAVEGSLRRLNRDCIDVVLLHLNELPVPEASPIFDALDQLVQLGKIRAYGWSTDYSDSAAALAPRANFKAVEYASNVFYNTPRMQKVVAEHDLHSLIRSPLAMGLLSGKYDSSSVIPAEDIRATNAVWMGYFKDGGANPDFVKTLDTIKELLASDGRSLVQGALGYLWTKSAMHIPIPGARTPEQIEGLAEALAFGGLSQNVVAEIDALAKPQTDEPERPE